MLNSHSIAASMNDAKWAYATLVVPVIALSLAVYLPLASIAQRALGPLDPVTLFCTIVADPLYQRALVTTLEISLYVTIYCLTLGVLLAIFMVHASARIELVILTLVVSSWWMSILLRSFIWVVLLQRNGPISPFLQSIGIVAPGETLLFTKASVIIAMTHALAPISILIFWAFLRERARELRQIALSLGASDLFYFSRVVLPQIWGATIAGGTIIFLLAIGFYITPELLGGGGWRTLMIGVLVEEQVNRFGDWQKASAISLLLVGAVMTVFTLLVVASGKKFVVSSTLSDQDTCVGSCG